MKRNKYNFSIIKLINLCMYTIHAIKRGYIVRQKKKAFNIKKMHIIIL